MADQKITQLGVASVLSYNDVLPIVTQTGTVPVTEKIPVGVISLNSNPTTAAYPGITEPVDSYSSILTTGTTDIYTVPAGKKFYIYNNRILNFSGGNILTHPELKRNSTYYRLSSNTTVNTGGQGTSGVTYGFIFEPGDIVAFNSSVVTNGGGALTTTTDFLQGNLFNSSIRASSNFTSVFSAGNNNIYTAPSTVSAYVLSSSGDTTGNVGRFFNYVNNTGLSCSVQTLMTYGGSIVGLQGAQTIQTSMLGNLILPMAIPSCQSIILNTTSSDAGQIAWLNTLEY